MPGRLVNAALTAAEPDVVKLRVGRSLLLHAKADVYRTAIVDPSICEIVEQLPLRAVDRCPHQRPDPGHLLVR